MTLFLKWICFLKFNFEINTSKQIKNIKNNWKQWKNKNNKFISKYKIKQAIKKSQAQSYSLTHPAPKTSKCSEIDGDLHGKWR
jgi:hypothetical protein